MKTILHLITLLILSSNAFSQTDPTKVPFVSYWSIGDSYDFKITKTKQQWKKGELTKDEKEEYIATFKVIDSTATSYTVNWSYENDLENTYDIPEALLERFSEYNVTNIKYKTSEVGDFIEVLNWEEVSNTMINMFNDLIQILGENDETTTSTLSKAMQPLIQIYSTKQGVEQLVLSELQYFHFLLGMEYNTTVPLIYDDEVPNLFGGKPIKAKSKIYFENLDVDENLCTVKHEMDLNPEDTKDLIIKVLKQMNIGDKKVRKLLKTSVMKIEDRNVYEYYYYPGIPRQIETVREVLIQIDNIAVNAIDKTVISLMYDD